MFGLLVNALVVYLGHRSTSSKLDKVAAEVHTVELATNSMKDALVEATREAALGEGEDKGRADLKAEQAADKKSK